jgi:hypothetical protein
VTLKEKVLFHQIHPAKLATDVGAVVISLYFLWQHDLVIGLLTHFTPPPIASAAVIRFVCSLDLRSSVILTKLKEVVPAGSLNTPSLGQTSRCALTLVLIEV